MNRRSLRKVRQELLTGVGSLFDLEGTTTLRRVQEMMPPPPPRRSVNQILVDASIVAFSETGSQNNSATTQSSSPS